MRNLVIVSLFILSSCGVSDSKLNSSSMNELDVGKYKLDVEIPVFASVNLKVVKIPPSKSLFTPSILIEKFEDGTSSAKVCFLGGVDMGGTKVSYEEVKDAYNVLQEPQSNSTYLIEIPNLKAIGKVSGFTVKIQSKQK